MADRYYSFALVTYNTNESDIQPLIDKAFKYAWILHDKDKTDPHLHILCTFKQNKSFENVRKLVTGEQNTLVQLLRDKYKAFQYLTHENEDEEKASYEESEIHCNDISYFQRGLKQSVDNEEFIIDLLNTDMSYREMGIKYGRDYIRNFGAYRSFAHQIRVQERIREKFTSGELERLSDYELSVSATGEVIAELDLYKYLEQKSFAELVEREEGNK